MRSLLAAICCVLLGSGVVGSQAVSSALIWKATGTPITNEAGMIKYLVSLTREATDGYSDEISPELAERFQPRNTPRAKNMVADFEQRYGFDATDMTNWVGNSFTAYLTPGQVVALQQDPLVTLLTENEPVEFSAPWSDSYNGSEKLSWGRNAVNGKTSNGSVRVYVIDAGVGYHEDLNNVVTRVNASCNPPGTRTPCTSLDSVGCYQHATHVAGIIASTYNNNKGNAGVDADAAIISVSIGNTNKGSPVVCSDASTSGASEIASAMDWTNWDLIINGSYKVGIVNISISGSAFAYGGALNTMMSTLASPYCCGYVYSGAFVVQAAGNDGGNACNYAFGYSGGAANTSDGIMVVGAIDSTGTALGSFSNTYAGGGAGSNYGPCVEVWAPGKDIYSSWGPLVGYNPTNSSTWQQDSTTYTNYTNLTGTSMSAPHIAGVAAYLHEQNNYGSPALIEAAVRGLFYNIGNYDAASYLMNMVVLP